MEAAERSVALVLSGGGARGLAHIGVIEGLIENGYTISSIAGTSIGSVIGAVYISGTLKEFKVWLESTSKLDVLRLMDFAISKNGFIRGEKVFKQIRKYVKDQDIESLGIPFAAVAVDIRNHREIVFRSGNLVRAIRASAAIPTVLKPVIADGVELVDGGVLNPLPLNAVERRAGDLLVAVDLNSDFPYTPPEGFVHEENHNSTYEKTIEFINEKWSSFFKNGKDKRSGFFDLITNSIYAMQMKLTQDAIVRHKPDLLVDISRNACEIFEFNKAEEMIQYGRQQLELALNKKPVRE